MNKEQKATVARNDPNDFIQGTTSHEHGIFFLPISFSISEDRHFYLRILPFDYIGIFIK